jgi:hypothetical protein
MNVALKRIYLDQRDWIKLARQHYGVEHNEQIAGVLALVKEAARVGHVSFPLSAAHYIETYRNGDPNRRQRLGSFMAEISQFHTIASAPDLLKAEIEVSVCSILGISPSNSPRPFGVGARHAFGERALMGTRAGEVIERFEMEHGSEYVFKILEEIMLVVPDQKLPINGIALPSREFNQSQLDFELDTAKKISDWGFSRDHAHRFVLRQEIDGVFDILIDLSAKFGFDPMIIFADAETVTKFLLSLPAKGAICRMRMAGHENPTFLWQIGDLTDMSALGTASAYCDVVVAEKQWGDILQRQGQALTARTITNLSDLPALIVS